MLRRINEIDARLKRLEKLTDKLECGRDKYQVRIDREARQRAALHARQAVELPAPDLVDVRTGLGVAPLWEFLITVDNVQTKFAPAAKGKVRTSYEAPRPLPMKKRPTVEAVDPDLDFSAWLIQYQAKRKARAEVLANSSYTKRGAA